MTVGGAGWTNRTEIRSETSSRKYIVAQRVNPGKPDHGTWGCSCPGWIRTRSCKHLTVMGLNTAPRLTSGTAPTRPASRRRGSRDPWSDAAYSHYDTSGGFGSADEWIRIAEAMAAGRGRARRPRTAPAGQAADLALLGLNSLPAAAQDLVRAMRKKARALHPDVVHPTDMDHRKRFPQCPQCALAAENFTALLTAYERLLRSYPEAPEKADDSPAPGQQSDAARLELPTGQERPRS